MRNLIIKNPWGGLGDHLFMSHLPRAAKESGEFDKVFISKLSIYLNPETKHLVWELNPHVDGFTDEDMIYPMFGEVPEGKNILDVVSDFYRVPILGGCFQEPEIYYKPKCIPELKDAVILDYNSFSGKGIPSSESIKAYFKSVGVGITHQMSPLHPKYENFNYTKVKANGLENLCDIIYSCKAFFSMLTGSTTLAAAIRKPTTVLYIDGALPMFRHSKLHTYIHL